MRIYTRFFFSLLAAAALISAAVECWAVPERVATASARSALASRGLLNAVASAGKRIVAAGQRGHILYSDDAGKSWIQAEVPVSSDLTALHFPTEHKGWAVGHDGVVLASVDGGRTWVKQLDGVALGKSIETYYAGTAPAGLAGEQLQRFQADMKRLVAEGLDKSFLAVWFEDETTGYAVGAFNLILRTADGGASWIPWFDRTDNPSLFHFYAIDAVGSELYVAGEQGIVLKLDRAARRFRAVPVDYKGSLFGITGSGPGVLVYGLRGNAFRSADAGAHWQKVETGVPVAITAATVTGDGRIVMLSQAGHVLRSSDGGKTFVPAAVTRAVPASGVARAGGQTLVSVGTRGVNVLQLKQ